MLTRLILTVTFFSALHVQAQTVLPVSSTTSPDTAVALDEVQVFSFGSETSRKTAVTSTLHQNRIQQLNHGQEANAMLARLPSMNWQSDNGSFAGYSYLRLRGMDQTRINFTFDGVPLNEPEDQGVYFSNYPNLFNCMRKVEVTRGAGNVINGNAAYAGSVRLFSPHPKHAASGNLDADFASLYNGKISVGRYYNKNKPWTCYMHSPMSSWSRPYKENTSNFGINNFYSFSRTSDHHIFRIQTILGTQSNKLGWIGITDSVFRVNPRANANLNEKDGFVQSLTQFQHKWIKNNFTLQNSVYYTFLDGNYDFNLDNFLNHPPSGDMYNYAFQSHFVGGFSTFNWNYENLETEVGIHYNNYQRRHTGSSTHLGRIYRNTGYKTEKSAYARVQYVFLERIRLFAETQLRQVNFDYKGTAQMEKITWDFANAKTGISVILADYCSYSATLATTGREPTRTDLFGGNDDALYDSTGKAMLFARHAENVIDIESNLRFYGDDWDVTLNVYDMRFKNELILNGQYGPNSLALTSQLAKSYRRGMELEINAVLWERWEVHSNFSLNQAIIMQQNFSFSPVLSPVIITDHEIIYAAKKIEVAALFRYVDEQYIDFSGKNTIPSYISTGLRCRYTFRFKKSNLMLALRVYNPFLQAVKTSGYVDYTGTPRYFVQQPTNGILSINYIL